MRIFPPRRAFSGKPRHRHRPRETRCRSQIPATVIAPNNLRLPTTGNVSPTGGTPQTRNGRTESAPGTYDGRVKLTIELDREDDGRWIAEALELPGVICYGQTRDEAISNAERLAIEVIADRIAHGEMASAALAVSFSIPDEQLASH